MFLIILMNTEIKILNIEAKLHSFQLKDMISII